MNKKKLPQKPTNLRNYDCEVIIKGQWLTKLEISPDYEEKNKEFAEGLKKKGIKLSQSELAKVLITDDLIRALVQKLDGRKKIIFEGRYHQYTYYSAEPLYNQWDYAFRLVWCLDDNNPYTNWSDGLLLKK